MMKQKWIRSQAFTQVFLPNEYVAACGDSGTVYNFECNAGSRNKSYHVYLNGDDGVAGTSDDVDWSARRGYLTSYHPCGETHKADSDSGFYSGYMYEINWLEKNVGNRIPVVVWTNNGTTTHCTTNLDMSTWETQKS